MYSPDRFRTNELKNLASAIARYPFATLLTVGGEGISHLPFILKDQEKAPKILGHMAAANSHWRELNEKKKCKVLFLGPHGYISPAWYAPRADNVPTWNYVAVHVTGEFSLIEEPNRAMEVMDELVRAFENVTETGWKLPRNEPLVQQLMKRISVFEILNLRFEGKLKLSQNQAEDNRRNVIEKLKARGQNELAAFMLDSTPREL